MPQAFSKSSVLYIKLAFALVLVLIVAAVFAMRWAMSPPFARNEPVPQPIPFSHKHHVGDDGLDCRYCHTSVEKSSFAGMPSTQVCLTCHSQLYKDAPVLAPLHDSARRKRPLAWTRVHDLPDFVYFDHSIHVGKGVPCLECHGRVDQMPLTQRVGSLEMQWCLACHRSAQEHVRPAGEVFAMTNLVPLPKTEQARLAQAYHLQSERRLTDCSTCHR